MCRPHVGEALGLGFHHRAEVVAAIGALLLQVEADRGHVVIADRFGKHVAVTLGAERALDRMRGEQRVIAQSAQARTAGPCEGCGLVGHDGH